MSARPDHDRQIAAWLEEQAGENAPERLLEAARAEIQTTTQRRSWWPAWRDPVMNRFVAIGLGAAAVIVALFITSQLVGQPNIVGPPTETPSPSGTPASSVAAAVPSDGPVEAGTRYALSDDLGYVTLTFPTTGWNSDGGGIYTGHAGSPEETLLWPGTAPSGDDDFNTPAVYPDPCTHEGAIEFEDSLAGEAEAWAAVPGTELVSGPSDVTVDGRDAKSVVTFVPEDVGCENSEFWLLYDPECGAILNCTTYATWLGETIRIWIVDMEDGSRFEFQFEVRYPEASADLEVEIQRIVDSIQFE